MITVARDHLDSGFFLFNGKLYFAELNGDFDINHPVVDGKIQSEIPAEDIVISNYKEIQVLEREDYPKYGITPKIFESS